MCWLILLELLLHRSTYCKIHAESNAEFTFCPALEEQPGLRWVRRPQVPVPSQCRSETDALLHLLKMAKLFLLVMILYHSVLTFLLLDTYYQILH